MIPSNRVAILDRDGTMVIDRGYLSDPDGLEFERGAPEGLRWLHAHGYRLIVITNQSGIGRGFFPVERMDAMNERLRQMVQRLGARLAGIYYCPHTPDDGCECRKPQPGLLLRAAAELGFDPAAAVVIGDRDSDIEFGRHVGATTIRIAAQTPAVDAGPPANFVATDLLQAARFATSHRG